MTTGTPDPSASNAEASRPPKHHNLKCFTAQFTKIESGAQLAINRYLDPLRDFQPGDTITLHEGFPDLEVKGGFQLTGCTISARISHIDRIGCMPEYGTMSLQAIGMLIIGEQNGFSLSVEDARELLNYLPNNTDFYASLTKFIQENSNAS